MEAQRYPDDYDGIIAGAPANRWTSIYIGVSQQQFKLLAEPGRRLSHAKLETLRSAALAACGAQDGSKDGVIADPERCAFDPSVLACVGSESDQCLTPPKLEAVRLLYAGVKAPSGEQLLSGYEVGSEAGWHEMHFGAEPQKSDAFEYMIGFFKDFVHEDSNWDWHGYDIET
jgi:feruloyl esterase